jgi:hypothetical protein
MHDRSPRGLRCVRLLLEAANALHMRSRAAKWDREVCLGMVNITSAA